MVKTIVTLLVIALASACNFMFDENDTQPDAWVARCVAPSWPNPQMTLEPPAVDGTMYWKLSRDDFSAIAAFVKAMDQFVACAPANVPPACGERPELRNSDGLRVPPTWLFPNHALIETTDWDWWKANVLDPSVAWAACVESHCPDGVCPL